MYNWMLTLGLLVATLSLGCSQSPRTATLGNNPIPISQDLPPADRKTSAGFTADYVLAERINQIPGLQGAVVLLYNNQAFVGVHSIGDDHAPDPTTGHIPKERTDRIRALLRNEIPSLHAVYVTAETHEVGKLQAYGRIIQRGRDIAPFVPEIHTTLRKYWPTAKL